MEHIAWDYLSDLEKAQLLNSPIDLRHKINDSYLEGSMEEKRLEELEKKGEDNEQSI